MNAIDLYNLLADTTELHVALTERLAAATGGGATDPTCVRHLRRALHEIERAGRAIDDAISRMETAGCGAPARRAPGCEPACG